MYIYLKSPHAHMHRLAFPSDTHYPSNTSPLQAPVGGRRSVTKGARQLPMRVYFVTTLCVLPVGRLLFAVVLLYICRLDGCGGAGDNIILRILARATSLTVGGAGMRMYHPSCRH